MQPLTDFNQARKNMVDGQIRPNHITNPSLIQAMHEIPRELFTPKHQKAFAYSDDVISLGAGRALLSPLTSANIIEASHITEEDSVLVIACGTGYLSALIGKIAGSVVAVDDNPLFIECAQENMKETDLLNVACHVSPLTEGYPKHGPYSLIIIEGTVQEIPESIANQLEDQGRLVTILEKDGASNLVAYSKIGDTLDSVPLFSLTAPPVAGYIKAKEFVL